MHQAAGRAVAHNVLRQPEKHMLSPTVSQPAETLRCHGARCEAAGCAGGDCLFRYFSVSLQTAHSARCSQQELAEPTLTGNGPTA